MTVYRLEYDEARERTDHRRGEGEDWPSVLICLYSSFSLLKKTLFSLYILSSIIFSFFSSLSPPTSYHYHSQSAKLCPYYPFSPMFSNSSSFFHLLLLLIITLLLQFAPFYMTFHSSSSGSPSTSSVSLPFAPLLHQLGIHQLWLLHHFFRLRRPGDDLLSRVARSQNCKIRPGSILTILSKIAEAV